MTNEEIQMALRAVESYRDGKNQVCLDSIIAEGGNPMLYNRRKDICNTIISALRAQEKEHIANVGKTSVPLTLDELHEKRGMAVLIQSVDGMPVMYGMDRVAAVIDTVPKFGAYGKLNIVAIYGRNLTMGEGDYGKTWVAFDYELSGNTGQFSSTALEKEPCEWCKDKCHFCAHEKFKWDGSCKFDCQFIQNDNARFCKRCGRQFDGNNKMPMARK